MNAYNGQRIGAATVALGLAEGAYELALAYAQEREQFGRPICLTWLDIVDRLPAETTEHAMSAERRSEADCVLDYHEDALLHFR
jgi:hypothetical protein